MSTIVNVAGPVLIKVNTGSAGGLADLGYSANGVNIDEQDFNENVPGDENGGDAGPPIDVLHHGQIHIIQMELTKWDPTVAARISNRVNASAPTAGTVEPGVLYAGDSKFMRLLLTGDNFTRNYLAAIPRGSIGLNAGSRYSRQRLAFECHAVSGVIWNTTTT